MGNFSKRQYNKNFVKNIKGPGSINQKMSQMDEIIQKEISKRAAEITLESIDDLIQGMSMAIEGTFTEEYGFGKKRMNKLVNQLNYRLPDQLQFKRFEMFKISQDRLYDVVELLLDLKCNEKCRRNKKENCKIYRILKVRDIPTFNENDKYCPYRVTPGEIFTENELRRVKRMLDHRQKRIIDGKETEEN